MQVSLSPQVEKLVENQLKAGRFASADEVIEAAIVQLAKYDDAADWEPAELDDLRAHVAVGIGQLERGQGTPWSIDNVRREGQRLLTDTKKEER